MSVPLPAEISVIELPSGVHYRLPPRQLARYRSVGLALFIFGLILCAAPLVPTWKVIQALRDHIPPDYGLLWLGVWMLTVPLCVAGVHVWAVGLFIVAGHSEIEVRGRTLYAIERCGPLRWTWERSTDNLRRFFVSTGLESLNRIGKLSIGPLGNLCVITPDWKPVVGGDKTKPMWLAPGYPRPWLVALAGELVRRCSPPGSTVTADAVTGPASSPTVPVFEKAPDLSDYEELDEQPSGSKIAVERSANRLTLTVPPLGIRSAVDYFVGGTLACVVALGISQNIFAHDKDRICSVEGTALIAVFGWVLGVGFLLAGTNRARRRAMLAVVDDTLIVRQLNLFGSRQTQRPRQDVADVFVRHRPDSEAVDYWALEIDAHPSTGGPFSLLAHRDPSELRWLATVLRRALRCPSNSANSPPAGLVVNSPLLMLRLRGQEP